MAAQALQNSTHSTIFPKLSPTQAQVAAALAQGSTVSAAAEAAGVHRASVHNWLKSSPAFGDAIRYAKDKYLQRLEDELYDLSRLAMKTLRDTMNDATASPSTRVRASLAVLNRKEWALPVEAGLDAESEPAAEAALIEAEIKRQLARIGKEVNATDRLMSHGGDELSKQASG